MADSPPQRRWPATLAALALVLMLIVIAASAWLRLAQPRPACGDWPACRAGTTAAAHAPVAPPHAAAPGGALATVRLVHRVAATAVLLIVIWLVAQAWRERAGAGARGRGRLRTSGALLAVALALSLLGVVTPGSRAASVLLGNLLGGFVMLALAAMLVDRMRVPQRATANGAGAASAPRLARWAAASWLVQAALGVVSGAGLAVLAPPAHLALATASLPLAALAAWRARRGGDRALRRAGTALLFAVPVQAVLGMAAAGSSATPPWVLAHNVTAAIGLAALAVIATRPDLTPD